MPRLSPNTLLQRAIDPAVQDRITLADAYSREGEVAEGAISTAKQIRALKGRKLVSLNAEECEAARLASIFAEQWESSLADSWGTARERQRSLQQARLFREFRIRVWGKTKMEATMETATAVNVVDYLDRIRSTVIPTEHERMESTTTATIELPVKLPPGWTATADERGAIITAREGGQFVGSVTVSEKERWFALGVTSVRRPWAEPTSPYQGRGWRARLYGDAVAALRSSAV